MGRIGGDVDLWPKWDRGSRSRPDKSGSQTLIETGAVKFNFNWSPASRKVEADAASTGDAHLIEPTADGRELGD